MTQRMDARALARVGAAATVTVMGGSIVVNGQPVSAASFEVTTLDAVGAGSLHQAVTDANAAAGADTITFADGLSGAINLYGTLRITDDLAIIGPGTDAITISSPATALYFGQYGNPLVGSVSGLTISGADGSGILAYETDLRLTDVVITGNDGVGVRSSGGSFVLDAGTVSDNSDGGVRVRRAENTATLDTLSGGMIIRNSTISGNTGFIGGGVYADEMDLPVVIDDTDIVDNRVLASGGGVLLDDIYAPVAISNSYIARNQAGSGAGIAVDDLYDTTMTITDTVITGNSTVSAYDEPYQPEPFLIGPGYAGPGGGIDLSDVYASTVTLQGVTITDNEAGNGGGVNAQGLDDSSLIIRASTISGNTAQMEGRPDFYEGPGYAGPYDFGGSGGGILVQWAYGSSFELVESTVTENTANNGAGVSVRNSEYLSVDISGSTVSDNETLGLSYGPVLYGPARMTEDIVLEEAPYDTVGGAGGGIRFSNNSYLDAEISGSTIAGNVSGLGAGVMIDDFRRREDPREQIEQIVVEGQPDLRIVDSVISGNRAGAESGPRRGFWMGGGVLAGQVDIVIENSSVADNAAFAGAGVNVFYGSALIHGSTISGNTALYDDAAIQARGSFVDVHDTSIVDNESYDDVINVYESEVVITDSTISGNTGGDELIDGYESELAIRQTTIASNDVTALIDVAYTSLEVTQSTLSGNTLSDGEAIDAEYAEVTVNRSIIAGNGAARAFELYESSLDVRNSILPTVEQADVIGTNLVFADDPELGPLQDNGGETATREPVIGSPAIDAGGDEPAEFVEDQRGAARVVRTIDIGAVEFQDDPNPPTTTSTTTTTTTTTVPDSTPGGGPSISPLANVVTNPGGSLTIPFTVTDPDDDAEFVITVESDRPGLFTNLSSGPGGGGSEGFFEATVVERVIELTAGPTLGTATITVTASDGTATATETFEVEVLAATLPPTGSNSTNGLIAVVGASLIALGAGVRRTAKRQG